MEKHEIEYLTPSAGRKGERRTVLFFCAAGMAIGVVVTYPAVALATSSGGAGHGDYSFARALFPWTMLLAHWSGRLTLPMVGIGLGQFPFYGVMLGWAAWYGKKVFLTSAAILAAIHLLGIILCLVVFS